jgi:nitrogen fixation protein NifB
MRCHPCFDEEAHEHVGRVHLPVAPHCNIQCGFCDRKICANLTMQHPGWAQRLLTPEEALETVHGLVALRPTERFVVGVAGPGEPLANPQTFEALGMVHQEYPTLLKCVSSNGLLLAEKLPELLAVGVTALTVTINAPDSEVAERVYAWVQYGKSRYRGREGAELLLDRQWHGLRAALQAGIAVKVNTVLIPGVNDQHLPRLAQRLSAEGVRLMNIMPLIPGGKMNTRRPPTCEELRQVRAACERILPQFRRCEQCRADAVRFPTRGRQPAV